MRSRRSLLLFIAAVAVAASTAVSALASTSEALFFIQRSKNAAEVHYDARVNVDGTLDAKNPVDGYWFNRHADGSTSRNEISFLQKIAYGYDTEPTGNGTYAFKLKAFHERPMWLVKINGHWVVQTTIAGKQAYMKRLYVATDESGVIPKVLYVDVFGEDAASGAALTEHIVKS
jgi:hypothetical protein